MSTRPQRFPHAIKAIRHLQKIDKILAKIIKEAGPVRIEIDPDQTIYESLARSIFYQQVHAKAAAAIMKRVQAACASPDRFPTPQVFLKVPEAEIRAAGMSHSKFKSLTDLATRVSRGELPTRAEAEKLSDQEIIDALTIVRGIGPWTVQMMLIFTFGRPDVFPVTDYGVRNGFSKVYGKKKMIEAKKLEPLGEHWRPYRTVASWYMWRATEFERFKEKKKPKKKIKA